MLDERGVCPLCERGGALGEPCPERVCAKKGYHYVPGEYVAEGRELDPMIGRSIDEYLVVSLLGAGGFGKVFLALQQPIQLKAALKLMHGHLAQSDMARRMLDKFYGEARALAQLTHPNIVRLLKFGVLGDAPYMVMEFVEGGRTLLREMHERLASGRELSAQDVRVILKQVIDGLEAAHRRGIVHRDIKPENIMLQQVAGNPWFVRVLDFGLAKDLAQGSTTSVAMGTPMYMAPEQLERSNIGPWTDWYAVGTMAFELMTGRRPFHGRTHSELLKSKLDPSYDPLTRVSDLALPGPVQAFFRTALHRSPDHRYREAAEFRAGLAAAVDAIDADASLQLQSIALHDLVEPSEIPVQDTPGAVLETMPLDAASVEIADAQARLQREREALADQRRALEEERRQLERAQEQAARPEPVVTGPAGAERVEVGAGDRRRALVFGGVAAAVLAIVVAMVIALGGGPEPGGAGAAPEQVGTSEATTHPGGHPHHGAAPLPLADVDVEGLARDGRSVVLFVSADDARSDRVRRDIFNRDGFAALLEARRAVFVEADAKADEAQAWLKKAGARSAPAVIIIPARGKPVELGTPMTLARLESVWKVAEEMRAAREEERPGPKPLAFREVDVDALAKQGQAVVVFVGNGTETSNQIRRDLFERDAFAEALKTHTGVWVEANGAGDPKVKAWLEDNHLGGLPLVAIIPRGGGNPLELPPSLTPELFDRIWGALDTLHDGEGGELLLLGAEDDEGWLLGEDGRPLAVEALPDGTLVINDAGFVERLLDRADARGGADASSRDDAAQKTGGTPP